MHTSLFSRTFYIDSVAGNDSNAGTLAAPYASFAPISGGLGSGSIVYVKRGSTLLTGKSFSNSVTLSDYSTGTKPIIDLRQNVRGTGTGDWAEVNNLGVPTGSTGIWAITTAAGASNNRNVISFDDKMSSVPFVSVKGSSGVWTEVNTSGVSTPSTGIWRRTWPASVGSSLPAYFVSYNGLKAALPKAATTDLSVAGDYFVDATYLWVKSTTNPGLSASPDLDCMGLSATGKWAFAGTQLFIRHTTNPFTAYTSIKASSSSDAITLGSGGTAQNFTIYGANNGIVVPNGGTLTGLTLRWMARNGIRIESSATLATLVATDISIRDCTGGGENSGCHGVLINGTGTAGSSTNAIDSTFTNLVIDNCGEDCLQVGNSADHLNTITRIYQTNLNGTRITRGGAAENAIDIKSGVWLVDGDPADLTKIHGPYIYSAGGHAITLQGYAGAVDFGRCVVNMGASSDSGALALYAQERAVQITADRALFSSMTNGVVDVVSTGQEHYFTNSIAALARATTTAATNGVLRARSGTLRMLQCTLFSFQDNTAAPALVIVDQTITSGVTLSHNNINDGAGFYTATMVESNTDRYIGSGNYISLADASGTTADSGWVGLYEIATHSQDGSGNVTVTFKVPVSASPTQNPTIGNLTVGIAPVLEQLDGNFLHAAQDAISLVGGSSRILSATGGNYVSRNKGSSGKIITIGASTVTSVANVESTDGATAGTLKNLTGDKMGGTGWQADAINAVTTWQVTVSSVTGISVTSEVATVTQTAHGYTIGQAVFIRGATPSTFNGWQYVTTTPTANTWTFVTLFEEPDGSATGTITATEFLPLNTSAAWQASPTYTLGQTKDVFGTTIPASSRHYGAVQ